MDGEFWLRMLGLLAVVGAMFVVPVITLWRDGREDVEAHEQPMQRVDQSP